MENDIISNTHFGNTSHPCCMKAPRENQRLLPMVKSFVSFWSSPSTCHSTVLNLLTRKRTTLTPMKAKAVQSQISWERGSMKEKTWGGSFSGFLIMMLIPKLMYGLVKSSTFSLSDVIVNGAIAMSASWNNDIHSKLLRMHFKN